MNKIINICGTSRSGSTMLDLMLGHGDKIFSLGEVYAWFRPFRTHHFRIVCSCNDDWCPWNKLKNLSENDFFMKSFEILDVKTLIDSSKDLVWVIDNNIFASNHYIKICNIVIFKEPASYFFSYWKRNISLHRACKYFISYYSRIFQLQLPYVAISYDLLVSQPSETLRKLCEIVDIPYFPGKENFWEGQHHQLFGSRGTRIQIQNKESHIEKEIEYPQQYLLHFNQIQKYHFYNKFLSVYKILKAQELVFYYSETKISKPYWYFVDKFKQKSKKYFPEQSKYDQ